MSNSPFEIRKASKFAGQLENIKPTRVCLKNTDQYFVPCFPERFNVSGNDFAAGFYPPPANLWGFTSWENTVDHWYRNVDLFNSSNVSPYV